VYICRNTILYYFYVISTCRCCESNRATKAHVFLLKKVVKFRSSVPALHICVVLITLILSQVEDQSSRDPRITSAPNNCASYGHYKQRPITVLQLMLLHTYAHFIPLRRTVLPAARSPHSDHFKYEARNVSCPCHSPSVYTNVSCPCHSPPFIQTSRVPVIPLRLYKRLVSLSFPSVYRNT
jgi:hypothetical protein